MALAVEEGDFQRVRLDVDPVVFVNITTTTSDVVMGAEVADLPTGLRAETQTDLLVAAVDALAGTDASGDFLVPIVFEAVCADSNVHHQ